MTDRKVRNHEGDPKTMAEQIKAIYPIVTGQKPSTTNSIPPHGHSNHGKEGNGRAAEPQAAAPKEENLIDI